MLTNAMLYSHADVDKNKNFPLSLLVSKALSQQEDFGGWIAVFLLKGYVKMYATRVSSCSSCSWCNKG